MNNCLADFLPFRYQKVKNYFWLVKMDPLATIEVMQLNIPSLKSYFWNLFWTLSEIYYSTTQISVKCKKVLAKCFTYLFIIMDIIFISRLYQLIEDWQNTSRTNIWRTARTNVIRAIEVQSFCCNFYGRDHICTNSSPYVCSWWGLSASDKLRQS